MRVGNVGLISHIRLPWYAVYKESNKESGTIKMQFSVLTAYMYFPHSR